MPLPLLKWKTNIQRFVDKYDLLEKVLRESVIREVIQEVSTHVVINEETIKAILLSIIKFQTSISSVSEVTRHSHNKSKRVLNRASSLFFRVGTKSMA